MSWSSKFEKVVKNFEELKRILRNWAIVRGGEIRIIDPPFTITISKVERSLTFEREGEVIAVVTEEGSFVEEGYEGVVEEWLTALTSLGFKRYIPKL